MLWNGLFCGFTIGVDACLGGKDGKENFGNILPKLNALGWLGVLKALLMFNVAMALVVSTGTLTMFRGLTPLSVCAKPSPVIDVGREGSCECAGAANAKNMNAATDVMVMRTICLPWTLARLFQPKNSWEGEKNSERLDFVKRQMRLAFVYALRTLNEHHQSAVFSSNPIMRLKFCTATPLAPRTRLSIPTRTRMRPRTTRTVMSTKLRVAHCPSSPGDGCRRG